MKKFIKDLKISHVLILMGMVTVIFIAGQTYNSKLHLEKYRDYIHTFKNDKIEPIILLYSINDEYAIHIVYAVNQVQNKSITWEEGTRIIVAARDEINKIWELYSTNIKDNESQNQLLTIHTLSRKADIVLDKLSQLMTNRDEAGLENFINNELYAAIEPVTHAIQSVVQKQKESIRQMTVESDELYNTAFNRTRDIGIGTILIISFLTGFIIMTITKSLKQANENIKKISEGDLMVEIEGYGNDEIGELLHNIKGLVYNLRTIMGDINAAANNIAMTSHELSTNSQQISQGATEQAASVEQMAASMEEISANVIQTAKNANAAEQISVRAGEEFENGRENIDTTVDAIQTIASKITIIGEIAFQTNILALNAAVEAARAGEHGKGFGVVAAEVGKLAERSKIAAAEIDILSKSGVELSLLSKELLKIALPSIDKTVKLVKEISLSSSDQSMGIDQINTGIQTLNHVTQQNAASSEEMATVAEEMASQAEQLSNSISFFNIGNESKRQPKWVNTPKYIEHKSALKNNKIENQKGVELDLDKRDDLDNEFETF